MRPSAAAWCCRTHQATRRRAHARTRLRSLASCWRNGNHRCQREQLGGQHAAVGVPCRRERMHRSHGRWRRSVAYTTSELRTHAPAHHRPVRPHCDPGPHHHAQLLLSTHAHHVQHSAAAFAAPAHTRSPTHIPCLRQVPQGRVQDRCIHAYHVCTMHARRRQRARSSA